MLMYIVTSLFTRVLAPWLTNALKVLIRQKDSAFKKYRARKTQLPYITKTSQVIQIYIIPALYLIHCLDLIQALVRRQKW